MSANWRGYMAQFTRNGMPQCDRDINVQIEYQAPVEIYRIIEDGQRREIPYSNMLPIFENYPRVLPVYGVFNGRVPGNGGHVHEMMNNSQMRPLPPRVAPNFVDLRIPVLRQIISDSNMFQVNLRVKDFFPADISVQISNRILIIVGEHEERPVSGNDGRDEFVSRSFRRKYELPYECDFKTAKAQLSNHGWLTVTVLKHFVGGRAIVVQVQSEENAVPAEAAKEAVPAKAAEEAVPAKAAEEAVPADGAK